MAGQLEYSTTPASNTAINSIGIVGTVNTISNVDDAIRQAMADAASAITRHAAKAAGSYTPVKTDYNQLWRATGAVTLNLTAAATLTDGWCLWVKADGGAITVDPSGAELINGAATLTGTQTLTNKTLTSPAINTPTISSPTITGSPVIVGTDAGTSGPALDLYHDSASPAAGDIIIRILANGEDSAGNKQAYGSIGFVIDDPVSTSEDAHMYLATTQAGTEVVRVNVGLGLYMEAATGSDPGAGKINATGYNLNGTTIPFVKSFESAQQTITAAGSLTLAHSLGTTPKLYTAVLQCTTGEDGYSIGDEVGIALGLVTGGADNRGISVVPDATNLNIRFGSAADTFFIVNKTTGAAAGITNANWRLVVRAWA